MIKSAATNWFRISCVWVMAVTNSKPPYHLNKPHAETGLDPGLPAISSALSSNWGLKVGAEKSVSTPAFLSSPVDCLNGVRFLSYYCVKIDGAVRPVRPIDDMYESLFKPEHSSIDIGRLYARVISLLSPNPRVSKIRIQPKILG